MRGLRTVGLALLIALATPGACRVGAQLRHNASPVPPNLVIVCRGLTLDALNDPMRPQLRRLARHGSLALVSTPTPPPHDTMSAALSLALGRPERALASDALLLLPDEPIESTTADVVFARRTGTPHVAGDVKALLHLGIGPLLRRQLVDPLVGAVAERAAGRPVVSVLAQGRPGSAARLAGLLALTASGICPMHPTEHTRVEVTGVGTDAGALEVLLARAAMGRRRVWVVPDRGPEDGTRLGLAVLADERAQPGLLTSNTTRTPGLIASSDVGPTMLAWAGVAAPRTMHGSPVQNQHAADAVATLRSMDHVVEANASAMTPVLLGLGVVLAAVVFPGIGMLRRSPTTARRAARLMPALLATPFGLLVAPAIMFATGAVSTPAIALTVVGAMCVAACACALLPTSPDHAADELCARIYGLAALAILADAALGGRMIRFSLLSSFQLSGIRFYGVGNEFMGMLIGTALAALALRGARAPLVAAVGLATTAVVGLPMFGANGGGAVTAIATFGMAWWIAAGRKPSLVSALLATALGVVAAVAIGFADARSGHAPTHLGAAMLLAQSEGPRSLADIALRKARMAADIATAWGVLLAVVGSVLFLFVAFRWRRTELTAMVERRPHWWRARHAVVLGSVVALAANDSGAVPALFIFGAYFASGIYLVLSDAGHVDKKGITGVQSSHV